MSKEWHAKMRINQSIIELQAIFMGDQGTKNEHL